MNRRLFGQMFASTLGLPMIASAASQVLTKSSTSGNLNLQAIHDQYHKDLFEDYLPFHERFVIDHKYGGFACSVRPNGERVNWEKITWFQGRGMWAYSFLYNNLAHEKKYLDFAAGALRMVERSKPQDPEAFWPKELKRDGTPYGPSARDIYGDMFIAEGLVEFSRASGERKYWDQAREIVLKCLHKYDQPDYLPEIGQTYLGPSAPPFPGARIEGHWMVFLGTTTQMLAMHPDQQLQQISDRSIDALLNYHYNPRFQLINELVNHDLSRPTNLYEQLVYAGHAIETLWMVMYEARRRNDPVLFDRAGAIFRRHCEVAEDRVYGGLLRDLKNVDQNDWTLDKTLFVHQEAITGSMCLIEETGDPWAMNFFPQLDQYIHAKFPMRSLHSPLWQVTGDRWVTIDPNMTRAENYHQPRFLMRNLLAVQRLIARGGKPLRSASDPNLPLG
jgi:N-acylglucosamine 2-epimerase